MKVDQTPAVCLLLVLCACTPGQAQEGPRIEASAAKAAQESPEKTEIRGTPYLGGYALFTTTYTPDRFTQIGTVLTPVLLIPFGNKWLIETKFVLDGEYKRDANSMQWDQTLGRNFELIQLDYIASRYLTVVAGRFLTPFGIFNERQHAPWIKKLQIQPFIATGAPSGNGGMLKGAFEIGSAVQLNYAAYFSALTTMETIKTRRTAGSRIGLAFSNHRLEFGTSFQRVLQDGQSSSFGFDATWLPLRVPLEVRAEYSNSVEGDGYWVEAGYRFSRRNEGVLRMEQFFVPSGFSQPVNPGPGGDLPIVNTRRPMLGWNYYLRDGIKFGISYGRQFTARGDTHVGNVVVVYRFQ